MRLPAQKPARAHFPITRSPAQGSAYKDLGRNGQRPAITPKATYTPIPNRADSRSLSITRSPAQKSACKDLRRNGQNPAITPEATYTPTSNRAGSRSLFLEVFPCKFHDIP
ncbi:IMP cyclohydrolase [Lacticaseibacillus rhamnosus]|nr:IMP cyclohydrolase [Lacticaseibacillus rhamnosus]MCT3153871.1 IMP cyclohydrolase [Lacticaseibacillus rhamnosus]MCT3160550.1 IMP cyclohydrolase [Lacticaseibacillus rhamnosus]MCT3168182.1 IMP cyclohydrolase [Lacticaseibacillus rhamnosus]